MAISNVVPILVGAPNQLTGSESLRSAFLKINNNFSQIANTASPYSNVTGNGVLITANSTSGTLDITNTGVLSLTAGTNISLSASNGNITISSTGGNGGGGGTVTSIGIATSTLSVTGSPIVGSGNIVVNLPVIANVAGTYTYPQVTVDQYGRVSNIANGASVGTVTSVGVTPGTGIQVTNSPITASGNITITNTGVTRLNAGLGIALTGNTGNITVSTLPVSAVTSVNITSNSLSVFNGPITSTGAINVEIPNDVSITGNLDAGNILTNTASITNVVRFTGSENLTNGSAVNLAVTASYFSTSVPSTATLAAGATGLVKTFAMLSDGGDMVITVTNAGWKTSGTGTITFDTIGDSCTLQYIANKWFCIGMNGVVFA